MSKTLKFTVDLEGLDLPPQDAQRSPQELVSVVIHNIIHAYSRNGLKQDERKQYYRIVEVMDEAVKAKSEEVLLEDTDAGFLRKCCRESQMVPNRLLQRVESLIDDINKTA